jgi:glycine/D-amino acid oxidase-like deaminating enzyme
VPADDEPIIGAVAGVPGLSLAVMHSAITLAPAVGRLVARELVDGVVEPALAGCRLDRVSCPGSGSLPVTDLDRLPRRDGPR